MKNEHISTRNRDKVACYLQANEPIPQKILKEVIDDESDGVVSYADQFVRFVQDGEEWCDAEIPFIVAGLRLALKSLRKSFAADPVLYEKYKSLNMIIDRNVTIHINRKEPDNE